MRKYESQVRTKYNSDWRKQYNTPTGQGDADYQLLIDFITEFKPKCIVEYGSGFSTRIIQKTINDLELDTKFFSFEDNKYYYDFIKKNIECTEAMQLCPMEKVGSWKGNDKLARYYHSYDGMEDVDFVIIDGPDVGRYNIRAVINVVDLHERFSNNKINVFIQGRKETTKFYIEKYGDSFKRIGKNGWGVL